MDGIDAARGAAMFFSCLAHFGWWIESPHPRAASTLGDIGMVATPTFLILSGVMTGWLCATSAVNLAGTRYKLLNRGLFLLTFGHLFIALAEAHRNGGLLRTITDSTIVDEIGLFMLICAGVFPTIAVARHRRSLLAFGIAGFAACWAVVLSWHPAPGGWLALRQVLLGPDPLGARTHFYTAPTLQYACLFAIGIGASDAMVRVAQGVRPRTVWRTPLAAGMAMIGAALLLRTARWALDRSSGLHGAAAFDLTSTIAGKLPPTPAYVLFYAGTGLAVAGVLFRLALAQDGPGHRLVEALAVVGRASLFVFVLQYFVYWTLPDLIGLRPTRTPLVTIFLAGLALNWLGALWWNRIHGNRFLTLGIGRSRPTGGGPDHGPGIRSRTAAGHDL